MVFVREPDGKVNNRVKLGFVELPAIGDHVLVGNSTMKVIQRMIHSTNAELVVEPATENFFTGEKFSDPK